MVEKKDSDIVKELAKHIGIKIETDLGAIRSDIDKREAEIEEILLYYQGVNTALYVLVRVLYQLLPNLPQETVLAYLKDLERNLIQNLEPVLEESMVLGCKGFLDLFCKSLESSTIILPMADDSQTPNPENNE